ncbi:MAG: hypothetical protein QF535_05020, partial [Anaerolineales bacterium]|nr:hypothetical protein [Anaerolineales bacterium]
FGAFWDNFVQGLLLIIMVIPLILLVMVVQIVPYLGLIVGFLANIFLVPYMVVHYCVTSEFKSTFDFKRWWRVVGSNVADYVVSLLKTIVYVLIYGLLSFVIIGIPSYTFGGYIYLADFYYRNK